MTNNKFPFFNKKPIAKVAPQINAETMAKLEEKIAKGELPKIFQTIVNNWKKHNNK